MMKKQLLLSFCLVSFMSSNAVYAMGLGSSESSSSTLFKVLKGACLLGGGAWAFERLKNSYDDWKNDHAQPATFSEDLHNVGASILCTAMFAVAGDVDHKMVGSIVGSGVLVGSGYLALKRFGTNTQDLRLREFVPVVAAIAAGREAFIAAGLPAIKFGKSN